jgi:large subunit ribosomal protein L10
VASTRRYPIEGEQQVDRAKKAETIETLNSVFAKSGVVVVAHYTGMTVADMGRLRGRLRDSGASFKVSKNRLAVRALSGTKAGALESLFTGPTGVAYSEDPLAAVKAAVGYAKENDKFVILGGMMGELVLKPGDVKALAELPSLDQLRAKIIGLIQAPATKLAGILQAPAGQLARVISAHATKSEAA